MATDKSNFQDGTRAMIKLINILFSGEDVEVDDWAKINIIHQNGGASTFDEINQNTSGFVEENCFETKDNYALHDILIVIICYTQLPLTLELPRWYCVILLRSNNSKALRQRTSVRKRSYCHSWNTFADFCAYNTRSVQTISTERVPWQPE